MYARCTGVKEPATALLRRAGGRWLRERREAVGLSQRQLAERIGVEYVTFISQIESGRGRVPPERYRAWASALGMEPAEFVRNILRYYDPITHEILFGDSAKVTAGAEATWR